MHPKARYGGEGKGWEPVSLPRSLMFITPVALELCLLWPFSLGGDDDKPWTAESTLESGSVMVECAY